MPVLELVGWVGSAVLVISLLQTRVMRFRVLNTISCVVLIGYNALVGVWPMAAMNVVLVDAEKVTRETPGRCDVVGARQPDDGVGRVRRGRARLVRPP